MLKGNASKQKRYQAVKKTLELLAADPRHNSLQTHKYSSLKGPNGEEVFEAYAEEENRKSKIENRSRHLQGQQRTPAAFRVFWYYGPGKGAIIVFAITAHL